MPAKTVGCSHQIAVFKAQAKQICMGRQRFKVRDLVYSLKVFSIRTARALEPSSTNWN